MSQFKARYPTTKEEQGTKFQISEIGMRRDCKFYISDSAYQKSGFTFRVSYDAANQSRNYKDICTYVGSMMCDVSKNLKDSVLLALRDLGVKARFVQLPYQAREHGINEAAVTEMEWPSILVYFGCICILLLKDTKEIDYQNFMSKCIHELQKRVGLQSGTQLIVPFDFERANAIRTMLGASLTLRTSVTKLIMYNMDQVHRAIIRSVCHYLFDTLSWYGMDELIFLNEKLVIPKSPVLCEPRYLIEAQNLAEACAAIEAHPYPQFFMHLASNEELMKVDISRFPTLIEVAKRMELERQRYFDLFG